jgi:hypothetical protein
MGSTTRITRWLRSFSTSIGRQKAFETLVLQVLQGPCFLARLGMDDIPSGIAYFWHVVVYAFESSSYLTELWARLKLLPSRSRSVCPRKRILLPA